MGSTNRNSVSRSFGWSFLEQVGAKAVGLILQIILARLLDPEAFGLLALILVVTHIADSIAQSGLGAALVQKKDASSLSFSTAFWLSCGIAVALFAVIFLTAPLFERFYGIEGIATYLRALAFVVVFNSANSIQRSYLQKHLDFKKLFIVSTGAITISGVVGIVLAVGETGVWALVAQSLSQSVLTCLFMFRFVPWKPNLAFSKSEAQSLFSYGWKICLSGLLGTLYDNVADLVIGKTCTTASLGYYSQGKKWPHTALIAVSNSLQNVLFPAFSKMQDDIDLLSRNVKKAIRLGSFVFIPASFLAAVVAEPLIEILLTDKWLPSTLVFQLICLGDCFMIVRITNLRAYMALGDSALYLRLQTIKVVLGIAALSLAALLTHNIYVIAATRAVFSVFTVWAIDARPASRMLTHSRSSQFLDVLPFILLAAAASAAAYPLTILQTHPAIILLGQIAVFTVVYFLGAKMLRINELAMVGDLARKVLRKSSDIKE